MSADLLQPRRVLVTGAAGFIGYHLCERLLDDGVQVLGVDSLTPYYDPRLKADRLARLSAREGFRFERLDLADRVATAELFARDPFDAVLHLAAQAGVRYSVENPLAYLDSNLAGMMNVLEGRRHARVGPLLSASSSSVYGAGNTMPLSEDKVTDRPVSLYAASKKANEVMAYSYSHLYDLPATGLRLFTVYGPWGRPDMAIFRFVRERVSGYKLVRRIEFSDLPKTISGKIRRVELRGQENARPAQGARSPREFLEEDFR